MKKDYVNYAQENIKDTKGIKQKIVILTCEDSTICEQQDKDCDGINCKTCQFNKIGVGIRYLQEQIYRTILQSLDSLKNSDSITKAEDISYKIINLLLQEENNQKIIGEKIYEDKK